MLGYYSKISAEVYDIDKHISGRILIPLLEKWDGGNLIQTKLERFPLCWHEIEELKVILEQIGFEDIIISADYKHGQYPADPNQTITFEATVNK